MTAFRYRAARGDGHGVRGVLEAATPEAAAATLSARGLFPVRVEAARGDGAAFPWRRPSARARATVLRSLATLVTAGVPLERALEATERVAPGTLSAALARVAGRVREGVGLGAALAAEGALFSGVTLGLVRAGERGVGLGPALEHAAAHAEGEAETGARVRAALAYPALLAAVGSLSVAVIILVVIPRFAAILGDLGEQLPPATRALLAVAALVRHDGLLLGAAVATVVAVAVQSWRLDRRAWHERLLRAPILGDLRLAFATARVTRILATLLGTGTPALAALGIARDAAGDAAVAARLERVRTRVAEGGALAAALRETRAVTDTAAQLAAIGEGGGRLPALLEQAAVLEEQRAQTRLRTLVALLEPGLIIAFAALVAFVAAALLQAIYSVRPT